MNSSVHAVRQTLINDLKDLHAKKFSCLDFASKYKDINTKKETNGMLPDIRHVIDVYLDEETIRNEDPTYQAMQEAELIKLIGLIENNASVDQINNINFFGESGPLTAEELKIRRQKNIIFGFKLILVLLFIYYGPIYALKVINYFTGVSTQP